MGYIYDDWKKLLDNFQQCVEKDLEEIHNQKAEVQQIKTDIFNRLWFHCQPCPKHPPDSCRPRYRWYGKRGMRNFRDCFSGWRYCSSQQRCH